MTCDDPTDAFFKICDASERRCDEYLRQRLLEGLGLVQGVVTVSYGYFQHLGLPPASLSWAFPILMAAWLAHAALVMIRDRRKSA